LVSIVLGTGWRAPCRFSPWIVATRIGNTALVRSADVFVTADGLIYSTDYNGSLYIMEFDPASAVIS
jgi:hypothetical protein